MLRDRLRAPAVRVAPGAAEAAAAHVGLIAERLVLVNRQLAHARSQLDRLVHQLAEAAPAEDPDAPAETAPAPSPLPPDAAILRSLPGIGTGVLATLLAEGNERCGGDDALRCLCGVARSPGSGKSAWLPTTRDTTGLASRATRSPRYRRCEPRPWTRSLAALAARRLRHAPRRHLLRPACRKCHSVNSRHTLSIDTPHGLASPMKKPLVGASLRPRRRQRPCGHLTPASITSRRRIGTCKMVGSPFQVAISRYGARGAGSEPPSMRP